MSSTALSLGTRQRWEKNKKEKQKSWSRFEIGRKIKLDRSKCGGVTVEWKKIMTFYQRKMEVSLPSEWKRWLLLRADNLYFTAPKQLRNFIWVKSEGFCSLWRFRVSIFFHRYQAKFSQCCAAMCYAPGNNACFTDL